MSVQPIDNNKSSLGNGIKSALIGGGIGYVSKFMLPLTSQEKDADYREIISKIKTNSAKVRFEFRQELKEAKGKSVSKDAFIKSVKSSCRDSISDYNKALRSARPTKPFIIFGAICGFMISFIHRAFN